MEEFGEKIILVSLTLNPQIKRTSKLPLLSQKDNPKDVSKFLDKKLRSPKKNGNLAKHFGKLKRNLDGLTYQLELRENDI